MHNQNDWRLMGQERFIANKRVIFKKWKTSSKEYDHSHCIFCQEKISDLPDSLHEGYVTEDGYYWICSKCYEDFKDKFHFK